MCRMSNIFIQDLHIQALFFIFPETQVMTERRERIDGGKEEEEEEKKSLNNKIILLQIHRVQSSRLSVAERSVSVYS